MTEPEVPRTVQVSLGTPESRVTVSLKWLTWACAALIVLLSQALSLYVISDTSAGEETALDRVEVLEDQLTCRSKATIESDLAKIDGYLALLGGLKISLDENGDGAANRLEYQATLNDIVQAEFALLEAAGARALDLAAIAGFDCPDNDPPPAPR